MKDRLAFFGGALSILLLVSGGYMALNGTFQWSYVVTMAKVYAVALLAMLALTN